MAEAQVVEPTVAALAVPEQAGALVRPAASMEAIAKAFADYQQLVQNLLDEGDFQQIGPRKFPKKSAWRKLAVAFGVSLEVRERNIETDEDGSVLRADFVVRAVAPNGRYSDGWGACSRFERCCPKGCKKSGRHEHCPAAKGEVCPGVTHFSHAEHDIPATAATRSANRAASDLFGFGQVSAEEILDGGEAQARAGRRESKSKASPPQQSGAPARSSSRKAESTPDGEPDPGAGGAPPDSGPLTEGPTGEQKAKANQLFGSPGAVVVAARKKYPDVTRFEDLTGEQLDAVIAAKERGE